MPSNRKYYPHNSVLFVSSRTEEGLPIVANLVLNFIIWGILARARSMYQVKICHFTFMFNHFHMLLVVDNPEHVSEFIGYVKAEIAHAINRLLGRRQKTIWQDGYDSPVILTAEDVIRYICYLYLNPVKAHLVERVADYPGVSSWEMFHRGITTKCAKKLSRCDIEQLLLPALGVNEQKRMIQKYQLLELVEYEFILEPDAWVDCFAETRGSSCSEMRSRILSEIHSAEQRLLKNRRVKNKRVLGVTTLRRQSMLKEHKPKKYARRMICLCSDKEMRLAFMRSYKALSAIASSVYQQWKLGNLRAKIPLGMFSPRMPALASALPLVT